MAFKKEMIEKNNEFKMKSDHEMLKTLPFFHSFQNDFIMILNRKSLFSEFSVQVI